MVVCLIGKSLQFSSLLYIYVKISEISAWFCGQARRAPWLKILATPPVASLRGLDTVMLLKKDVSGQTAMEEEDTGMVSCCRQPSEEEGRLGREREREREREMLLICWRVTVSLSAKLRSSDCCDYKLTVFDATRVLIVTVDNILRQWISHGIKVRLH